MLVGRLESSVTRLEATAAIAALTCCPKHGVDVGPAMPAFFRLALTTVAVKNLLPNFPHNPPVTVKSCFVLCHLTISIVIVY